MPTNLNTASERELLRLPGVGATIAERIVAARPFTALAQLQQIKGIGPKRYLALVSDRLVTVGDAVDKPKDVKTEAAALPSRASSSTSPRRRPRAASAEPRLVDLNTASLTELCSLHGVGSTLAQRIVASRPFRRKDEITAVRGIGLITYEKMQHQLAEIRGTPAATAFYEYEQEEETDEEPDEIDKENEPQAASPTRRSAPPRAPPPLSPRGAPASRPLRCRPLPFCAGPSLNLLGGIRQSVLPRSSSKLLVASWNIRNLSKRRDAEPLHRIADILEQFDLVALQEVRDTIVLRKLKHFMPGWDYIASPLLGAGDAGDADSPRSSRAEHFAYFFRRRVVVPVGAGRVAEGSFQPLDMVRAPYIATFKTINAAAPALQVTLVNVHVVCGDSEARQREMNELWRLTARLQSEPANPNIMLLGDFNLSPQDVAAMGEGDRKFEPLILSPLTTTVGDKLLDNIWLDCRGDWHALDVASGVYRVDWAFYPRARGLPRQLETPMTRIESQAARTLCTFELSDHFPVWVALGEREGEEEAES